MIRALRKWRSLCRYLLVIFAISTIIGVLTIGSTTGSDWRVSSSQQSTHEDQGDSVPALHRKWRPDGDLDVTPGIGEAPVATRGRSEVSVATHDGSEASLNAMGILSMDEDLEMVARGKVQQARVDAYCTKYHHFHPVPGLRDLRQNDNLYRHLIVDDEEQVIFCFVEKAGCTNMKRLMFVNMGLLPKKTTSWKWVDNNYLEKALKKSNFAQKSLTLKSRLRRLKSHFKFMVVRNPLERLVSGYRNKIEPPLNPNSRTSHFASIQKEILRKYRPRDLEEWLEMNMSYPLTVSFTDFVRYLVDEDNRHINPHFRPMIDICQPCHIKYDFYANFRSLSQDVAYISRKIHARPDYYKDESLHTNATQTKNLLGLYYAQLPESLKRSLFKDWKTELDFYYHLYPDERNSHVRLLGVNEKL